MPIQSLVRRFRNDPRSFLVAFVGCAFLSLSSGVFLAPTVSDETDDTSATVNPASEMSYEARREMIDCLRGCRREEFEIAYRAKWIAKESELIREFSNIPTDNWMLRTAISNVAFVSTESTVDQVFTVYAPTGHHYYANWQIIYSYINKLNHKLLKYTIRKYADVDYWKSLDASKTESLRIDLEQFSAQMLEILALRSSEDEKETILEKYSRYSSAGKRRHCGSIRKHVKINYDNIFGTNIQSNRRAAERWSAAWKFAKTMDTIYPDLENFFDGVDTNPHTQTFPHLVFNPFSEDLSQNYKTLWYIALSKKENFSTQPVGTITFYAERKITDHNKDSTIVERFALPLLKLSSWALVSAQSGPRSEIFPCDGDQMSISDLIQLFQRAQSSGDIYIKSIGLTNPADAILHRNLNEYYDSVISWLRIAENTGGGNFISEKTKPFEKFKEEALSMGFPMYQINFTPVTEEDLLTFENAP